MHSSRSIRADNIIRATSLEPPVVAPEELASVSSVWGPHCGSIRRTVNFDTRQLVRFANEPNSFMNGIRFFAFPVCRSAAVAEQRSPGTERVSFIFCYLFFRPNSPLQQSLQCCRFSPIVRPNETKLCLGPWPKTSSNKPGKSSLESLIVSIHRKPL